MVTTRDTILLIAGLVIGFVISQWFFLPDVEVINKTVTENKTDTVFIPIKEVIFAENVKHTHSRDTVIIEHKPTINSFSATFPTLYGNAYLSGEVLGTVLKSNLRTDFKMPVVTNTIETTNTVTNTVNTKGLYIGGALELQQLRPSVTASYIDKDWSFDYGYQFATQSHTIGVKKRLF